MAAVSERERVEGPKRAKRYAERLAALITEHGGPKRVNVWQKPGFDTRVYFPAKLGWISVGHQGELDGTELDGTRVRSRQTLADSAMYPSWRKAVRAAIQAYKAELRGSTGERAARAAARVWATRQGGQDPATEKRIAKVMLRQTRRWVAAAKQDANPGIAVLHANYGAGWIHALREIIPDDRVLALTGEHPMEALEEALAAQDEAGKRLAAA